MKEHRSRKHRWTSDCRISVEDINSRAYPAACQDRTETTRRRSDNSDDLVILGFPEEFRTTEGVAWRQRESGCKFRRAAKARSEHLVALGCSCITRFARLQKSRDNETSTRHRVNRDTSKIIVRCFAELFNERTFIVAEEPSSE